jgi:hypothetical protein
MLALDHLKIVHDFIAAETWENSNASNLGEKISHLTGLREMLLCVSRGSGRIRIKHRICRNWDSLSLINWKLRYLIPPWLPTHEIHVVSLTFSFNYLSIFTQPSDNENCNLIRWRKPEEPCPVLHKKVGREFLNLASQHLWIKGDINTYFFHNSVIKWKGKYKLLMFLE